MSDIDVKIGATDSGFSRLLKALEDQLRRLGAASRQISREQIQQAREAAAAATENQRKQQEILRETIAAGKEQVREARDGARERTAAARDAIRAEQDNARVVAQNAAAAVDAVRRGATAQRQWAREAITAAKARRDADVGSARDLLASARESADAQRQAGVQGITAAREAGQALRAEAVRGLRARREEADGQKAAGRELLASVRQQARAEIDASRDILRANIQRTRDLREQFRQQVSDAKKAVADRRRALEEATGTAAEPVVRQQLRGARDRLENVREARDTALGGSRADVETARQSSDAVRQAAKEKIAATQEVVRSVTAEAQANVRAAAAAVQSARESSAAKVDAARRAAATVNDAAAAEVRAAKAVLDAEVQSGKTSVENARKQLDVVNQLATKKMEAARQAATAAEQGAAAEVNAAKRALGETVRAGAESVRAAETAARQARGTQQGILGVAKAHAASAKEALGATIAQRRETSAEREKIPVAQQQMLAIDGLVGAFKRLAVQYGALRAITAFVREGVDFNQTLETATLGIGALITAEAKLTDSTGRDLHGREALNVAMTLSADQMQKLRIAGLQTAATTEELVKAMQQAVGPGLAAGGNLDQIRNFTIQITQAAGAIGLPFHQLNEEVRSLLAGTINYNTRIAKSLGITNAMVREWKNQGVLFDRLNERFAAFNVAGQRSLQTMQVLRSTLTETFQVFAGAATKPFFEALRVEGFRALNEIFNFDTAKINDKFKGIVDTLKSVFQSAGDLTVDLIRSAIKGAEELSKWFDRNRVAVGGVIEAVEAVARSIGNVIGAIGRVVADVVKWGVESGTVERILRDLDKTLGFLADHMREILAAMVAIKAINIVVNLASLSALNLTLTAIVASVVFLEAAFPGIFENSQQAVDENNRQLDLMAEKLLEVRSSTTDLVFQFQELEKQAKQPGLSQDGLTRIREQQRRLVSDLARLNPAYAKSLTDQKLGTEGLAKAVENLMRIRQEEMALGTQRLITQRNSLELSVKATEAELKLARARAEAAKNPPGGGPTDFTGLSNANQDIKKLEDSLKIESTDLARIQKQIDANKAEFQRTIDKVQARDVTLTPNRAEVETDKGLSKRDAQIKKEADSTIRTLKSIYDKFTAENDLALEDGRRSYQQYYDDLLAMTKKNAEDMILVREVQQMKTVLPANKKVIEDDIEQIRNGQAESEADIGRKRLKSEQDLQTELASLRAQAAQAENRTADARRLELEAQFAKRRKFLLAQNTEAGKLGVEYIDAIVNIEFAKARLNDLQGALATGQDEIATVIDRVDFLHTQGAVSAEDQNAIVAASYGKQIDMLKKLLPEMRAFAIQASDERAVDNVRKLENELAKLEVQQRELSSLSLQLGHAARKGMEETLTGLFEELFKEGENLKTTLARLALGILQAMNATLAPQIAQTLTSAFNKAFNDLGSSAAAQFVGSFIKAIGTGLKDVFDATIGPIIRTAWEGLSSVFGPTLGAVFGARATTTAGEIAAAGAPNVAGNIVRGVTQVPNAISTGTDVASSATEQTAAATQVTAAGTQVTAAGTQITAAGTHVTAASEFAAAVGAMSAAVASFAASVAALAASAATSGIKGIAAGAIPVPGGASGGLIGGTSLNSRADDKLIRVTSSEFLHPVSAVRYYGLTNMEAIRRMAIPREVLSANVQNLSLPALTRSYRGAHLADGGLVSQSVDSARLSQTSGGRETLEIVVKSRDSHIVSVLRSKAGQQAQLVNMQRNQNATRRVLTR